MKIILQLLAVSLFFPIALLMFTTWLTTIILIVVIATIFLSIKEHQANFDDKLSNKRVMQAIERYIKEVKNQE